MPVWKMLTSSRSLRFAFFVIIVLAIAVQIIWSASLSELYNLLSGSTVGLNEKDVRFYLGKPTLIEERGAVFVFKDYHPIPTDKINAGEKVLIYKKIRYCAYVYIDRNDHVRCNFIARRF